MPSYCGGCRHLRRHQVGASAIALPTFEVAVGRRGAALAGPELIGVNAKTHRTARFPPLKTSLQKDAVEALLLGLLLHQARARHDHGIVQAWGYFLARDDLGDVAEVLDPTVRAGSDP